MPAPPRRGAPAVVRRATPDDAERIAAIGHASWVRAYRGLMPDELIESRTPARRVPFWRAALADPENAVATWVLEASDAVHGFTSTGPDSAGEPSVGEIYALYVDPACWRAGHGRVLTRHALETLFGTGFGTGSGAGCNRVHLWCLTRNAIGRAFYEAYGFRVLVEEHAKDLQGHAVPHTLYGISAP